jgi:hypothetical protein
MFVLREQCNTRDEITVLEGEGVLEPGTVLSAVWDGGTAVSAASAGNTGDGVMGAIVVGPNARNGVYRLTITAEATDAGSFVVTDSAGSIIGFGEVDVAFDGGGLEFTLADGAADFVVGDQFTITVSDQELGFVAYEEGLTANAILAYHIDTTDEDVKTVGVMRNAVVREGYLIGADALALEQLQVSGIVARSTLDNIND